VEYHVGSTTTERPPYCFITPDFWLMKVISARASSSVALQVEDSRLKNVNGNISFSLNLNLESFGVYFFLF